MTQEALWLETWIDAVKAVIDACGGPKKVGVHLRSDLAADDAGEWLLKTLRPNRREVLSAPQLIELLALGRRNGCDVLAAFVADRTGYEAPKPMRIELETERVTADLSTMMARMTREMDRLHRLQQLVTGYEVKR